MVLNVQLVQADEWEGLYIDGMLRAENHSIEMRDLPLGRPMSLSIVHSNRALETYLDIHSGLPLSFAAVTVLMNTSR